MKYDVVSLDVWGNAKDGYDVNQSFATGVTVDIPDVDNDADIIVELIDHAMLSPGCSTDNIEIDGDDYCLYINRKEDCYPLFELRRSLDQE